MACHRRFEVSEPALSDSTRFSPVIVKGEPFCLAVRCRSDGENEELSGPSRLTSALFDDRFYPLGATRNSVYQGTSTGNTAVEIVSSIPE